jgi:REP element-mobilizing transposase RayT
LKDDAVAGIVKEAIDYRDKKDYDLISYCIMPNHVHMVFTPIIDISVERSDTSLNKTETTVKRIADSQDVERSDTSLYIATKILQDLKAFTAREANKILNRTGQFWQHESYDHVVRNYHELKRIVNYVIFNPIKAGLVENWKDWKWSYVNEKYF